MFLVLRKNIDAVRDVSFTCSPGSVFTLLGPNGTGKTTLPRMIATMLRTDLRYHHRGGSVRGAPCSCFAKSVGMQEVVRAEGNDLSGGMTASTPLTPGESPLPFDRLSS